MRRLTSRSGRYPVRASTTTTTRGSVRVGVCWCPASRSWQGFGRKKCRENRVGQAQVHLLGPTPSGRWRCRHARLDVDHLEVLEGPSRPSADFFQTRSSTSASPRAWVKSATSASSCSSRVEGPDRPAASAVLPASRNSAFHRPIDYSLTFSRRADPATLTSPANTLSTTRVFCSARITGGLPIAQILLQV
jgi:hypothetical protein